MLHSSTLSAVSLADWMTARARMGTAIAVAGLTLTGCGSAVHPARGRGVVDSPITTKTNHLKCLRQQHLPVVETGPTSLQIGPLPDGPTVLFEPTPGAAQSIQIRGVRVAQGAEVIGSALLFPNRASDGELKQIETCLAKGVSG